MTPDQFRRLVDQIKRQEQLAHASLFDDKGNGWPDGQACYCAIGALLAPRFSPAVLCRFDVLIASTMRKPGDPYAYGVEFAEALPETARAYLATEYGLTDKHIEQLVDANDATPSDERKSAVLYLAREWAPTSELADYATP